MKMKMKEHYKNKKISALNMRILWFTNTPSNYKLQNGGYNGGGWISSLETEIKKNK